MTKQSHLLGTSVAALLLCVTGCSSGGGNRAVALSAEPRAKVRVLVGVGCPRTTARDNDVSNNSSHLDKQLLPSANPTGALICYYGSEFEGTKLVGRQKLDTVQASALATIVNRIDVKTVRGVTSCPAGTSPSNIVFAFSYSAQSDVDLWMHATGCESLDNGHEGGTEGGNPSFYRDFLGAMQRLHDSGPKGMGR
jgi:hypothetical protein